MTAYNEIGWKKTIAPVRVGLTTFRNYWAALLEWHEREKLRTNLYDLSDRELHDIGIAGDQIEYFVSNRFIDPRGVVYVFAALNSFRVGSSHPAVGHRPR